VERVSADVVEGLMRMRIEELQEPHQHLQQEAVSCCLREKAA
jgi:FtsZ-binding cell division protein ZapB